MREGCCSARRIRKHGTKRSFHVGHISPFQKNPANARSIIDEERARSGERSSTSLTAPRISSLLIQEGCLSSSGDLIEEAVKTLNDPGLYSDVVKFQL